MRDRLIELIESARYWGANTSVEIADHLLAEGVIVPKVKIGDKLYELSASKTKIYEVIVTHLEVHENDIRIYGKTPQWQEVRWMCCQADLGNNEWFFLTREEAERVLAERSKE